MASKKSKACGPVSAMSDGDWRARSDAEHLMSARQVQADPKRHKAAQTHLKQMQREHLEKAAAARLAQKPAGKGGSGKGKRGLPPRLAALNAGRGYLKSMGH